MRCKIDRAMPFRALDATCFGRTSLLVCDGCDTVFGRDGSAAHKFGKADPSDLAPHYDHEAELRMRARAASWSNEGKLWMCSTCASSSRRKV